MERIDTKRELTSSEAADLFDVHASTVKRWCNEGALEFEQTPGGHRRIRVDAAAQFARERGIVTVLTPFHPFEPHVWIALMGARGGDFRPLHTLGLQWARRGDFERLERLFVALGRSGSVSYSDFCDAGVRGIMASVGDEWQDGKLRIGDEHMVSQAIIGALHTLRREWLDRPTGASNGARRADPPVAVVGTMEGNHHQLGALCVRLLLEREGWRVFYPGPDVPLEDFGTIQKGRQASLVCISLPPAGTIGDVSRSLEILRGFYDRARPYSIVFGGASFLGLEGELVEGPFESVTFLQDLATLQQALADGLGRDGGDR